MGQGILLAAASLSAAATATATAIAWEDPALPGEPFGLRLPGDVRWHLALGLGSGIAVPWPMPLVALAAAIRHDETRTGPALTCAALGAITLVGTLAEPATWGLRPRSDAAKATVALNLLSGSALFLAGTWTLSRSRGRAVAVPAT